MLNSGHSMARCTGGWLTYIEACGQHGSSTIQRLRNVEPQAHSLSSGCEPGCEPGDNNAADECQRTPGDGGAGGAGGHPPVPGDDFGDNSESSDSDKDVWEWYVSCRMRRGDTGDRGWKTAEQTGREVRRRAPYGDSNYRIQTKRNVSETTLIQGDTMGCTHGFVDGLDYCPIRTNGSLQTRVGSL